MSHKEIEIAETLSFEGKTFFPGKAFVSEADAKILSGNPVHTEEKPDSVVAESFPEDYPGFEILGAVEGMSRDKLEAMTDEDILAIKGIGKKTLEEIRAYK